MKSEFLVAITTLDHPEGALELVRELVDDELIACGTVIPQATSIYRWQGVVESARESVVIMKLRAEGWAALEARIQDRHPYEVPELVALPITDGSLPYLAWLRASSPAS